MSTSKGPVVQEALESAPHKFTLSGQGSAVTPEDVDLEIRRELRILL